VFAEQIPLLQYGIFLFELNIAQKKIYYKRFDEQFLVFLSAIGKNILAVLPFFNLHSSGKVDILCSRDQLR